MDGTKVEISGGTVKEAPLSGYKQIPESDKEAEIMSKSKDKIKSKSPEKDGADEKMLPEKDVNVKFISSNEKQNGDAKVDLGELKSTFVGLGKEELMKYANDPFWVRLRWFLFIGFWLLWIAMLVGAIVIIIGAPKCSPPKPRTWWEQGPLTEIEAEATAEELKQISNNGIQGVIVPWEGDAYTSFNVSDKFISFLNRAKDVGVNVIVGLAPGASSIWFYKSATNAEGGKYNSYYIWTNGKTNSSGNVVLPNNWKSKQNVSAWKFSNERNQFYLSPEEAPQLNFRNSKVIDEFSTVLQNLLDSGVKGVRLHGAPQLLVDNKLTDEMVSQTPGFGLTDYGFYTHTHTEYVEGLGALLEGWREIIKNKTDGGPLMLSENLKNLNVFEVNNTLMIDLPNCIRVFGPNKQLSATQINSDLSTAFSCLENNKHWPLWQHNNSALPSNVLDIVTLLLPGTVLVQKGVKVPSELLTIRNSQSVMHGNTTRYLLANDSVFAFVRSAAGNPGYLVALNPTDKRIVVNFSKEIPSISEEVTVQYFSQNYNETDIVIKKKTNADAFPISPESAIVLSYVPKS